jgi:hypothetical protein
MTMVLDELGSTHGSAAVAIELVLARISKLSTEVPACSNVADEHGSVSTADRSLQPPCVCSL